MKTRKRSLTRRATTPPATGQRHVDVRMMMLGRGGVGKSALTVQYLCHRFLWEYDPTLEDTYIKDVAVDGKSYRLHILDTAGECHNVDGQLRRERQIREAHCFVLVYSVVDRLSFRAIRDLLALVARCQTGKQRASRLPVVLVGNKSDLASSAKATPSRKEPRQVTYEEGESLAEAYGVPFFETSAATDGAGVQRAFHAAIHLVQDRMQTHKLLSRKASSMSSSVFDLRLIFKDKFSRIIHINV